MTRMITNGDSSVNPIEGTKNLYENMEKVFDGITTAVEWCKHLPEHIADFSAYLLVKVYELLMLVLQTPLFIFNNTYIKDAGLIFAGVSILLVTILTMFEGIKRMLQKRHTGLKEVSVRYGIAVAGAGLAPLLFEKAFELINMVTEAITKIGSFGLLSNDNSSDHMLLNSPSPYDWVNTGFLLGFDIVLFAMIIPIFLQNGRRFFDLMCLAAITPLALSTWVFKEHKYLFDKWWGNVKRLGTTPLVYAVFICIMGLFIFGTSNVVGGGGLLIKLIIVVGGLSRMSQLPTIVKSRVDNGGTAEDSVWGAFKGAKDVYDTVTLNKLKTKIFFKNRQEEKAKKLKNLKREHGKRNVRHLL